MCSIKNWLHYIKNQLHYYIWVSKLQTKVTLSMLHSEYAALSLSMSNLLPHKTLCVVVIKGLGLDPQKLKYNTKSKLFEDNDSTLKASNCPIMTPGIKYIDIKYKCFREKIQNGEPLVEDISGNVQKEDILKNILKDESSCKL